MRLCNYGCRQVAKHQFKNGKYCCSKSKNSCSAQKLFGDKNPSKREDVRKLLGLKGNLNPSKRPEVREQIRQSVLEKYKDPVYIQNCKDGRKREPLIGNLTILCSYGCGNLAKYQFKNGNCCCSKESSECQVIAKKNPGNKDRKQTKESNEKRSKSMQGKNRECMENGGAAYANSFVENPSKPQIELFNLACQVLPRPIHNYPIYKPGKGKRSYNADIADSSLGIIIEYDGSYWHNNEKYDQKRQNFIEEEGWKFLRYVDRVPTREQLLSDIQNLL